MATKTYGTTDITYAPGVTDTNGYIVSSFTPDDWGGNINPQESRALYVVTRAQLYARVFDTDAPSTDRNLNFIMGTSPGSSNKENVKTYNTSTGSDDLRTTYGFFAATTSAVIGSNSQYWAGGQAKSASGYKSPRLAGVAGESIYANSNLISSSSQQYMSFDYYGLPNATSSVSATTSGQNSVSLSWASISASGVAGAATGYKVQYKTSSSSTWLDFTTTSSTSTTVSGLSSGTAYDFRVAGVISAITSVVSNATGPWSFTASATTESDVPPVAAPSWTGSFNSGTVNSTYSTDFARAIGHDAAYGNISLISGSLPPGLGGSPSGEYYYVSGTPLSSGTYNFTLRAQNDGGTTDQQYSIYIATAPAPIWVDQTLANTGTVGEFYSDSVSATNVTSWSYSGTIPSGTNFSNGSISGTLTTPGQFNFTITASNASGSTQRSFTITVQSALLNGGNRMTGSSSSTPLTIYKRYDGSSWIELSIAKRYNGSSWEDI
jgi:hypothetical protein